jgi:hypothetical protein
MHGINLGRRQFPFDADKMVTAICSDSPRHARSRWHWTAGSGAAGAAQPREDRRCSRHRDGPTCRQRLSIKSRWNVGGSQRSHGAAFSQDEFAALRPTAIRAMAADGRMALLTRAPDLLQGRQTSVIEGIRI